MSDSAATLISGHGPPSRTIRAARELFEPHNRKFLGSKHRLLDFILPALRQLAPRLDTFADVFAGTGSVGLALNAPGTRVVAVDLLPHAGVVLSAFLESRDRDLARTDALVDELNALEPRPGYYARSYGGTYFTRDNAARIDALRDQIDRWPLAPQERRVLLASLVLAADKVANTCGQYDAFLKHLEKGRARDMVGGVHVVDRSVYGRLTLKPLRVDTASNRGNRVLAGDANALARDIGPVQIAYLDPPYNTRQYCDNYHVLDNIVLHGRPRLHGKTRKPAREPWRSRYSTRHAARALAELCAALEAEWIVLSYNSEGLLDDATLRAILATRGQVERLTRPYPVFGRGAGVAKRRDVLECLYLCRTTN